MFRDDGNPEVTGDDILPVEQCNTPPVEPDDVPLLSRVSKTTTRGIPDEFLTKVGIV